MSTFADDDLTPKQLDHVRALRYARELAAEVFPADRINAEVALEVCVRLPVTSRGTPDIKEIPAFVDDLRRARQLAAELNGPIPAGASAVEPDLDDVMRIYDGVFDP